MWKITWFSLVIERKYSNLCVVYKIKMPLKNNYVYLGLSLRFTYGTFLLVKGVKQFEQLSANGVFFNALTERNMAMEKLQHVLHIIIIICLH